MLADYLHAPKLQGAAASFLCVDMHCVGFALEMGAKQAVLNSQKRRVMAMQQTVLIAHLH